MRENWIRERERERERERKANRQWPSVVKRMWIQTPLHQPNPYLPNEHLIYPWFMVILYSVYWIVTTIMCTIKCINLLDIGLGKRVKGWKGWLVIQWVEFSVHRCVYIKCVCILIEMQLQIIFASVVCCCCIYIHITHK